MCDTAFVPKVARSLPQTANPFPIASNNDFTKRKRACQRNRLHLTPFSRFAMVKMAFSIYVPKTMSNRSKGQPETEHLITDENGGTRPINQIQPSSSSYTSSVSTYSSVTVSKSKHMTYQDGLVSDNSHPSLVEIHDLGTFHSVSLEPPITTATLSQIEFDRLYKNLFMRHDINFDPNIQYRPIPIDRQGAVRMTEASSYWDALNMELIWCARVQSCPRLYFSRKCNCTPTVRCLRKEKSSLRTKLVRLPRMFEVIREILHSLLPKTEWLAIDERLDTSLLVQELENSACDYVSLGNWLANLLQRYYLSDGDYLISRMVSTIRDGVRGKDITGILSGLKQIFVILEAMKLVNIHQPAVKVSMS